MKFSSGVLALFTLTTASAISIPRGIFKRNENLSVYDDDYDYSYLGYNPLFPVKRECNTYIEKLKEEYKDCIIEITGTINQDEICKTFQSKRCQKYYKLRVADAPECKDSHEISVFGIDSMRSLELLALQSSCFTDENNKYCTFGSLENIDIENLSEKEEKKLIEKVKKDTCRSKRCTDKYLKMIDDIEDIVNNYSRSISKYKVNDDEEKIFDLDEENIELIKYFKSEECTSQAQATTASADLKENNKNTSKATTTNADLKENNKKSMRKPRKCIVKKN